jgi:hypothetical protein
MTFHGNSQVARITASFASTKGDKLIVVDDVGKQVKLRLTKRRFKE